MPIDKIEEKRHCKYKICNGVRKMSMEKYVERAREVVNAPETLEESRTKPTYFTRKRKMSFVELLKFLLSLFKGSAQAALDNFFTVEEGKHMSQQALSKARNHFDHTPFTKLFYETLETEYSLEKDEELKRWHGYKLVAIDGTSIALPNIAALKKEYGGVGAGAASPTARGSIAYDVENDRIIEADIRPLAIDERTLAKEHIQKLNGRIRMEDTIFLFDRGYPSEELIRAVLEQKANFLMRVRRKFCLAIDSAPMGSSVMELHEGIFVRVVKFELPSGEVETLITNLLDLDEALFPELYFKRWPVEGKFDIVKNKLELPNFTGWTANVIRQDFWISMFFANLAAVAKEEADADIQRERNNKQNKYEYQANVNTIIASFRSRFADAMFDENPERRLKKTTNILYLIARSVVPKKPNRSLPRNKNPRKVKFHHNRKSNI